ncbi:glycosyltransferase family 10 domain-containing protein [Rhizobium sp. GN54]|uniref:glycosyltransferase family 10 domain-containing protein n=1 Tax=Rhizobium sp. GN54 TaxID=2898150 RepID=UPI001E2B1E8C|nr:glycosyltransferase family 10 [Rhizobium sp. GN54]MCD2183566.1 glycosyltransferase family 10 [Rhizobium sp. GN54]
MLLIRKVNRPQMLKVHLFGAYHHRQPLAYEPIRSACASEIQITEHFEAADVVIVAHHKDLEASGEVIRRRLAEGQRLVHLSEEPFWDTVWAPDLLSRNRIADTPAGDLPYTFLNHATSSIFDFDRIPYFLLTDTKYIDRYKECFSRNRAMSPSSWRKQFSDAPIDIVFLAERRRNEKFDVAIPGTDILGLSALRTRIADACSMQSKVTNATGVHKNVKRQELEDWHADKFDRYDGRARFFSAIENTHQGNYVSEKLFDAFALRSVPIYIAGPGHMVTRLASAASWLNLWRMTPEAANQAIQSFPLDDEFLDSYAEAQQAMHDLFSIPEILEQEKRRLSTEIIKELTAL